MTSEAMLISRGLMTTQMAAARLGITQNAVIKAIIQGRLQAFARLGIAYILEPAEVERYRSERRAWAPGRPKPRTIDAA